MYYSHGLRVELAQGALWLWKAGEDYHGTTVNSFALDYIDVKNWAKLARDNVQAAQSTMVSVLPNALTNAAVKSEVNAI